MKDKKLKEKVCDDCDVKAEWTGANCKLYCFCRPVFERALEAGRKAEQKRILEKLEKVLYINLDVEDALKNLRQAEKPSRNALWNIMRKKLRS